MITAINPLKIKFLRINSGAIQVILLLIFILILTEISNHLNFFLDFRAHLLEIGIGKMNVQKLLK
jgi:hypothetical protein